jgi:hypothetical protein
MPDQIICSHDALPNPFGAAMHEWTNKDMYAKVGARVIANARAKL